MRAAVLRASGAAVEIEELDLEAPRQGEVRIEVAASGICHSDLSVADGTLRSPLPVVLGHEAAGTVVEVGKEVDNVRPGDRVVVALSPACGQCLFCKDGRPYLCVQMVPGMISMTMLDGSTRLSSGTQQVYQSCGVASFAEQAVVAAGACIPVPPAVPLKRACLLGCGVITGAGSVFNTAAVKDGMTVAVIGCGGVGLSAVQACRLAGAAKVIAVDREPEKLALARELGATHGVEAGDGLAREVRAVSGIGVDVAIEAVGRKETIEAAWSMLKPGGKAVVIGMASARDRVELKAGGFFQAKTIEGCVYGSSDPRRDIPLLLDLVARGDFRLDPLVSEELPLEKTQAALERLSRGECARQVIVN